MGIKGLVNVNQAFDAAFTNNEETAAQWNEIADHITKAFNNGEFIVKIKIKDLNMRVKDKLGYLGYSVYVNRDGIEISWQYKNTNIEGYHE